MSPSDIVWSNGPDANIPDRVRFSGLSLSSTPQNTLLDGTVDGNWWYSVGNSIEVTGGNPAVPVNGEYFQYATRTSLFIEDGKI